MKRLIVNNVVTPDGSDFLTTRAGQQKSYLDIIRERHSSLHIVEIPMFPGEVKGIERLKEVEKILFQ